MAAIGDDLCGIDHYAGWGARLGMLTWNEENPLATGAGGDPYSGLTELGETSRPADGGPGHAGRCVPT